MTQTTVNFVSSVVYSGPGQITSVLTTPKVFDFEISPNAQAYYLAQMNNISTIVGGTATDQASLDSLLDSLKNLNTWSSMKQVINGQQVDATSFTSLDASTTLTTTMDRYMAEQLENLNRTLRSAGFEITNPNTTDLLNALITLRAAPSVYQLDTTISRAISAAMQARLIGNAFTQSDSLQQVLMVDYVSRGNEMLFNEMGNLRNAIDSNQTVLGYLNNLQDLMNQKDPEKFIQQLGSLFAGGSSLNLSNDNYETYEKTTFNKTLGTNAKFADASIAQYVTDHPGATFVDAFKANILDPNSTTGANTIATIVANLDALQGDIAAKGGSQAGPLAQALGTIKADLQRINSIQTWVQDTVSGAEGDNQRHLNDAIVAAQSFNDTQREELRRVMFVFEEFYKSATALLSRLTQILEKMASFISR